MTLDPTDVAIVLEAAENFRTAADPAEAPGPVPVAWGCWSSRAWAPSSCASGASHPPATAELAVEAGGIRRQPIRYDGKS